MSPYVPKIMDEHYIPMLVNDAYQAVAALDMLMKDNATADQVAAEFNSLHEINGQLGRLVVRAGKHLHGRALTPDEESLVSAALRHSTEPVPA